MSWMYHEKLVRDKIPQIIEQSGKKAVYSQLSQEDLKYALKKKLCEEATEFYQANTKEEQIEELADLFEVVFAILSNYHILISEVVHKRFEKAEEKGSFSKGIHLHRVEE